MAADGKPAGRRGEFQLIAELFAPLAKRAPGAFGLKDDAATIAVPADRDLVATADALVEGVHFLKNDPPGSVAKKSLRVNLSDLAAKGATPDSYMLVLSLAPWVGDEWLARFAQGLASDQEAFDITLIGGDTTATPGPLTIGVTAFGTVPRGRMLRRAGARVGDKVFVSGTVGDAGGGLAVLEGEGNNSLTPEMRDGLVSRYRVPLPRTALGPRLIGLASSALDVSDGLLADLNHISEVSRARIVVEGGRVPVSESLRHLWGADVDAIIRAASCGDDYEIAFTAPPAAREGIDAAAKATGIAVHEIGRVEDGAGLVFLGPDGSPVTLGRLGFTHF
jgi:thiamine-monophosphate kinase